VDVLEQAHHPKWKAETETMEVTSDIFSDAVPKLLVHYFDQLHHGSSISVDVINERGYKSVLGKKELVELGFSARQARIPGFLIPRAALEKPRANLGTFNIPPGRLGG
jgi:hypothetical protein